VGGHSIHRYLLFSGVPDTRLDPPHVLVSRPRPPQALEALKTIPSLKYLQLDLSGNQLGKEDAAQGLSWGREGTPYPSPQMGMSRRAAWNDFPSTTPLPLTSIRCSGYGGGFEELSSGPPVNSFLSLAKKIRFPRGPPVGPGSGPSGKHLIARPSPRSRRPPRCAGSRST